MGCATSSDDGRAGPVGMGEADVLAVLAVLATARLEVWVDGGWAVDALVGRQTRRHEDLDLVVRRDEVDAARTALAGAGYRTVVRDWLPTALALGDDHGRSVDLHPVGRSPDGGGDQVLMDGGAFHYPAPVPGAVGGRPVRCVDAATQIRCHEGYQLRRKDLDDLARLRSLP